jgi:hypothetical protein
MFGMTLDSFLRLVTSLRLCPPGNLSKIAHIPTFPRTPKFLEGWAAADPLTDGGIYEAVILRADSSRTAKSGKVLDVAKK